MTEQEIFEKLIPLIREVTGVREDQITMDSGLMQDLGAESVDLLDFSFLIEETFDIVIDADEFEQQTSKRLNSKEYEKDGVLTDEALKELRKALPEVPVEYLKPGLKKIELPSVLNVAVFVHLIQRKLAEKSQEVTSA
ncbi:MAG: phosphopantetheine-binding protein [Anaerolineaceae bacterium]|nr:phosphopantetheine-binding protein [Anaerolineaceae bacterium]